MQKITTTCYKKLLLTMLGVTRAVSRVDVSPPSKWMVLFDNVRISSDILYCKLSLLDHEVEEEFMEKEEMFERRIGKEKFYSREEIQELKNHRDNIQVEGPRRPGF